MKSKPLVSIVTPSFNTGSYIESTIKSVLDQQYRNFEHIIIDGGSTDNTIDILSKYSHLNWISEDDKGQSHALNKGFEKINGDFVIWLNSDDVLTLGSINRAIDFFYNNPEIDMIYTDINIIDENDIIYGRAKGLEFSLKNLLENNPVKQPSQMFRSKVLDKLKSVDVSLHYTMDREFWLRMKISGFNIQYVPDIINASFRLCKGTKTFDYTEKFRLEWINVMQDFFKKTKYKYVSKIDQKKALNIAKSAYFHTVSQKLFLQKKYLHAFSFVFKAIYYNMTLIYNLGFYIQILFSIFNIEYSKTKKFKNEILQ